MDKKKGTLANVVRQLSKNSTKCSPHQSTSTVTVGSVHIAKVVVVNHPKPRQRRPRKGRTT